ncbi:MAG: GNAT family N-acetyltransferase [Planctomycetota bacterium]|nr:GNAT family N-acetyltransferase [Planctomycetota bacterium]
MQLRRFTPNGINASAGLFSRGISFVHLDPHIQEIEARQEKAREVLSNEIVPELTFIAEGEGRIQGIISAKVTGEGKGQIVCFAADRADGERITSSLLTRCIDALKEQNCQEIEGAHWLTCKDTGTVTSAFSAAGVTIELPERRNILMGTALDNLPPVPPPAVGYEGHTFRPGDDKRWTMVKEVVFGSASAGEFESYYSGRADFDPSEVVFVEHGDSLVAFSAGVFHQTRVGNLPCHRIFLDWVGALDEHRGKGLGIYICLHCMNHVKNKGASYCTLVTQPYRVPAVTLYKKLGFEVIADQVKLSWKDGR